MREGGVWRKDDAFSLTIWQVLYHHSSPQLLYNIHQENNFLDILTHVDNIVFQLDIETMYFSTVEMILLEWHENFMAGILEGCMVFNKILMKKALLESHISLGSFKPLNPELFLGFSLTWANAFPLPLSPCTNLSCICCHLQFKKFLTIQKLATGVGLFLVSQNPTNVKNRYIKERLWKRRTFK